MEVKKLKNEYPKTKKLRDGSELEVRMILKKDFPAIIKYFSQIPENELTYHRVNMFEESALEKYWNRRILEETSVTLLGYVSDELVGIVSLHQATASASDHVGYIRISVSPLHRSKGIASILASEMFNGALIMKLDKVCAELVEGKEVAKTIFVNKLGFKEEAVRIDHVKDKNGNRYNLIILYNDTKSLLEEIMRRAVFSSVVYGHEH